MKSLPAYCCCICVCTLVCQFRVFLYASINWIHLSPWPSKTIVHRSHDHPLSAVRRLQLVRHDREVASTCLFYCILESGITCEQRYLPPRMSGNLRFKYLEEKQAQTWLMWLLKAWIHHRPALPLPQPQHSSHLSCIPSSVLWHDCRTIPYQFRE